MKNKILHIVHISLVVILMVICMVLGFQMYNHMSKIHNENQTIHKELQDVNKKLEKQNKVLKTISYKKNYSDTDLYINKYCKMYGVEPNLVKAIIHVESKGVHNVKSTSGAIGIMQLTPNTAKSMGVDPYNKEQNIHGGIKYLSYLNKKFNGDTVKVVASYNAGETVVKKYNGVPPYSETRNYVKKVLFKKDNLI